MKPEITTRAEVAGRNVGLPLWISTVLRAYVNDEIGPNEATSRMWVCQFDGDNALCQEGIYTAKHRSICGEFWLIPTEGPRT